MKIIYIVFISLMLLVGCSNINNDVAPVQSEISEPPKENNNGLIEQIKNGDFSSLTWVSDIELENLRIALENRDGMEWLEHDINNDGMNELIYQEKDIRYEKTKRIVAIFGFMNSDTRLVLLDVFDIPRHYFLSENGNIIYHNFSYGAWQHDTYSHYIFDDELNRENDYGLELYNIYDLAELPDDWAKINLDMTEVGVYYNKYVPKDDVWIREALDERQFLEAFEEMTGTSFYDVKPDWFID